MKSLLVALVLMGSFFCAAQQDHAARPSRPVYAVFVDQLGGLEEEFVSAAEAMPEEKYEFVPQNGEFKGARTFAQQVKHVAAENILFAQAILAAEPSLKPQDALNGPPNVKSKAEVLKLLKESFAISRRALQSLTEQNLTEEVKAGGSTVPRLAIANIILWHSFDHYGQMAVYLRLSGIVPPASRPQPKQGESK